MLGRTQRSRTAALVLMTAALGAAGGAYATGARTETSAQATRTALAQAVNPAGADGRTLGLSRVVIPPHMVHFGANEGDRPVRILLATLFSNGSPPAITDPE